jgi:O-antigen ligase
MKKLYIHQPLRYIHLLAAFSIVILIPFGLIHITKYAVGTYLVSWVLIENRSSLYKNFLKNRKYILPLVLFYIAHLISLFYSNDINQSIFDLEKKLSLLFVPLTFFISQFISGKQKVYLLQVFILSAFLTVLIGIGNVVHVLQTDPYYQNLFPRYPILVIYQNLSVFLHSAYFAKFLVFSIAAIVYMVFVRGWLKKSRMFWLSLAVFFVVVVIINSSRSGIMSLSLLLVVTVLYFLKRRYAVIGIAVIVAGLVTLLTTNMRFQRYLEMGTDIISSEEKLVEKGDVLIEKHVKRPLFWIASIEVIKENFWFGVGNGDVKKELKKKYEAYNVDDKLEHTYNSHNQFLSAHVATGVPGLCCLILVFAIPLIKAIREKNYVLLSFMLIVFVHALTETILGRFHGIIFFSFFYGLVMTLNGLKNNGQDEHRKPGELDLFESLKRL